MVEGALNAAAEQVIEYSAYGHLLEREGNRAPWAAPQGIYPCAGHDATASPRWLALAVETDSHWEALLGWLGRPEWSRRLANAGLRERRTAHDAIDLELKRVFCDREREDCVKELLDLGIPAAAVVDARILSEQPQMVARRYYEEVDHAVVGTQRLMTVPFRFASVDRWIRRPPPTLGEHNHEVLSWLGCSDREIAQLEADGIIGTRPAKVGA